MSRDLNILVGAVGLSALGDWLALVPRVAGEARLAVANGRVETARYIGFTVGPVVGGLLAGAGGLEIAMVVNTATFLVVRRPQSWCVAQDDLFRGGDSHGRRPRGDRCQSP